jgi:hypothetical protein
MPESAFLSVCVYLHCIQGALYVEPSRRISARRNYDGLSYEAAGNLINYYHYRAPESITAAAALTRKGTQC